MTQQVYFINEHKQCRMVTWADTKQGRVRFQTEFDSPKDPNQFTELYANAEARLWKAVQRRMKQR